MEHISGANVQVCECRKLEYQMIELHLNCFYIQMDQHQMALSASLFNQSKLFIFLLCYHSPRTMPVSQLRALLRALPLCG